MFAIATLVKPTAGEYVFYNGILHPLPVELCDDVRIRAYARIDRSGWGISEFGYHYFSCNISQGGLLTMPGLIVNEYNKPLKKFYGYNVSWSRKSIEELAQGIQKIMSDVLEVEQSNQAMLVHDLRALSTTIYNSALEARRFLDQQNFVECKNRIENVIAAQGILKMRTDALDFVGNALDIGMDEDIPVFRKVDKVVRCFKARAYSQRRTLDLGGQSYRKIRGPDLLESVPYALIDNALKYSPESGQISVEVKDVTGCTVISVRSWGPHISEGEKEGIFQKGIRGTAALTTGVPGTGLGLHMVYKIVTEYFRGEVSVQQGEDRLILDGNSYFQTTFNIKTPSFD